VQVTTAEPTTVYVITRVEGSSLYLPAATEANLARSVEIHRASGAGSVRVYADGSDRINDSAAGGNLSSTVTGQISSVRLRVLREALWGLSAVIGTWRTDA
jgi:hypothetical protein